MYRTVKPTTFTLPLPLIQEIDAVAKETGKKKTTIVTEALEAYLDMYDLKIAKSRLSEEEIGAKEFFDDIGI